MKKIPKRFWKLKIQGFERAEKSGIYLSRGKKIRVRHGDFIPKGSRLVTQTHCPRNKK